MRAHGIELRCPLAQKPLPTVAPEALGFAFDDAATVAALPSRDFWETAEVGLHLKADTEEDQRSSPVLMPSGRDLAEIERALAAAIGEGRPARATWTSQGVVRQPEVSTYRLKREALAESTLKAVLSDFKLEVPLEQAPKHVRDEALASITDQLATFTTHFPVWKISRNNNIRVAAGKLNGTVLMPGEQISFNTTVGRRTIRAGFQDAGIFKNGKHDHGIGGGICQVSSTLYNAALLSDLKIVRRHNHSMPVAYLPVGRDATVDYGQFDLVLENPYPTPVAISSDVDRNSITFRVLGKPDPTMKVKIVTTGHRSWEKGFKYVEDPTVPAGKQKVVDKGSRGHVVWAYRLVTRQGQPERREYLGRSFYGGAPKLIGVRSLKAPPAPPAPRLSDVAVPASSPTIPLAQG
ncbi:MAG: VanW family protein [Fimbriimonas ginsengisoli]|uniref:VanW family protein n=1 Tax=Fimbriimonas ginsengisoli TaxID=1005039 RepID=A0A931PWR5_FIMGI|nr:VanW family protein [Fimbriimonas ginsengisoli]